MKLVKGITISIIALLVIWALWGSNHEENFLETNNINKAYEEAALAPKPNQLIRFHVLANSDTESDQELKRAVRDAILKEVSPQLAVSQSLDESRQILKQVRPKMERIGRSVVKASGKDYLVHTEYGQISFPTKSYGSLVLPAGDYEALQVVIGEGKGSNWWCVLFPPLCFIDIDHSTAIKVDNILRIPNKKESTEYAIKQTVKSKGGLPKVRFYFWEKIKILFR